MWYSVQFRFAYKSGTLVFIPIVWRGEEACTHGHSSGKCAHAEPTSFMDTRALDIVSDVTPIMKVATGGTIEVN